MISFILPPNKSELHQHGANRLWGTSACCRCIWAQPSTITLTKSVTHWKEKKKDWWCVWTPFEIKLFVCFPLWAENKAYISQVLFESSSEEWSESEQEEEDEKSNSSVQSQEDKEIRRWLFCRRSSCYFWSHYHHPHLKAFLLFQSMSAPSELSTKWPSTMRPSPSTMTTSTNSTIASTQQLWKETWLPLSQRWTRKNFRALSSRSWERWVAVTSSIQLRLSMFQGSDFPKISLQEKCQKSETNVHAC